MNVSVSCTFTADELKTALRYPFDHSTLVSFMLTREIDDIRGDRLDLKATVRVPAGKYHLPLAQQASEDWDEPDGSITLRFDHDALTEISSTMASRELRGLAPVMASPGTLEIGFVDPNQILIDAFTGIVNTPEKNLVLTLTLPITATSIPTYP